jgi:Tol biopolymer transport system component
MAPEVVRNADESELRVWGRSTLVAVLCLFAVGGGEPRTAASAVSPAGVSSRRSADLVYSRALGDGKRALCVATAAGGPERRLTDGSASDGLPRWTRDGRAVIFSSNRSGNWQLWQVAAEGGSPRRLRTNACNEWQADLSPDGRTLAFLSDCGGPQSLWLMDLTDGAARLLVRHGRRSVLGNPHWSPDARRIVFSSNHSFGHQIFVVDAVSGDQRRVSSLLSGGCEPRFSPDGSRVVHVTRGHRRPTSRLVEIELANGAQRTLVDWPALNYDPAYSPDGAELAFASNLTGKYQVYRLRLSDGKIDRVTSGPGEVREPDYRPSR